MSERWIEAKTMSDCLSETFAEVMIRRPAAQYLQYMLCSAGHVVTKLGIQPIQRHLAPEKRITELVLLGECMELRWSNVKDLPRKC